MFVSRHTRPTRAAENGDRLPRSHLAVKPDGDLCGNTSAFRPGAGTRNTYTYTSTLQLGWLLELAARRDLSPLDRRKSPGKLTAPARLTCLILEKPTDALTLTRTQCATLAGSCRAPAPIASSLGERWDAPRSRSSRWEPSPSASSERGSPRGGRPDCVARRLTRLGSGAKH